MPDYQKTEIREKRKMGHFTVINDSVEIANQIADEVYAKLKKWVRIVTSL